jgi:hypothetical protein
LFVEGSSAILCNFDKVNRGPSVKNLPIINFVLLENASWY